MKGWGPSDHNKNYSGQNNVCSSLYPGSEQQFDSAWSIAPGADMSFFDVLCTYFDLNSDVFTLVRTTRVLYIEDDEHYGAFPRSVRFLG